MTTWADQSEVATSWGDASEAAAVWADVENYVDDGYVLAGYVLGDEGSPTAWVDAEV